MLTALSSMLDPSTASAAARSLEMRSAAEAHRASSVRRHRRASAQAGTTAPAPRADRTAAAVDRA
ncbi:hypothetical protein WDZ17_09855 [Pseudokineococcus basanitobsidens]|uniref:Uncharacterized protein n=1 Tax=Pseudokineococcus basanitobsidens TaxID=1926649 RepID=A0ABU8RKH2_9ACTN